jgi:hypothetical protein
MTYIEDLLYSAEEHGKRQQMFKELTDADDKLETLNKYWGDQPLPF